MSDNGFRKTMKTGSREGMRVRSIRQSAINAFAAILAVATLSSLGVGIWILRSSMQKANLAVEQEKAIHLLADSMKEASDFLTDQVRAFAVTHERSRMNAFWTEVEAVRRREKAIEKLEALGVPKEEGFFLENAKRASDHLIETEARAMRLVTAALGYPEGELPLPVAATTLTETERGLQPEEKMRLAVSLVFGPAYEIQKQTIIGNIGDFNTASQVRTARNTRAAQDRANKALILVMSLCIFSLVAGTCFIYVYYLVIAGPVAGYIRELEGEDVSGGIPELTPRGTRELVALAEAFNLRRTERISFEKALRNSERRMRIHLQMMPLGELEVDRENRILVWNPAAERIFGFTEEEALGREIIDFLVPEKAREEVREVMERIHRGERVEFHVNRNLRKDGSEIICEWYNTLIHDADGTWTGWASIVKDITKQSEESEKILYLSRHDPLTGLYNRRYLVEKLEEARLRTRRNGVGYSTIMIDIDNFKKFNDLHGHECGDLVLKTVATGMSESLRATDSVGRWGGEEFLILLPETDSAGAFELGERIRQRIEGSSAKYREKELKVTITVGVAACRDGDEEIDDCIRRADEALLTGKAGGRNRTESSA